MGLIERDPAITGRSSISRNEAIKIMFTYTLALVLPGCIPGTFEREEAPTPDPASSQPLIPTPTDSPPPTPIIIRIASTPPPTPSNETLQENINYSIAEKSDCDIEAEIPTLEEFAGILSEKYRNENPHQVVGIYFKGKTESGSKGFALEIVQQKKDLYVPGVCGIAAQFGLAARNGVLGILAHNYLEGKEFESIIQQSEREIAVFTAEGRKLLFKVTSVDYYQMLEDGDYYLNLNNVSNTSKKKLYTDNEIFNIYYGEANTGNLTLQTCLQKGTNKIWGKVFIVAEPSY
ncbi:hypothetical protein A3D05_00050 [Candidatus Gottesmanbacteria bacterium RIFCSPHIGHO2_02_FULL_40_24]|uniref:Sortase n=1 Tax=Candidatus Gottesmanbacteria bacterium RIFCSPHIGHO2_01_FULL_40_15 TaxID=1798376 RepID=A0A1F5Z677_9BACT|nr:MAG: hypothetical protein A2777_00055 [Candidatus Gottesmanbacteria bacterium RIFCSPHIGHO2_01_FULL_40_15]OGG17746.1 MAG: hypothetical protein A3D05_00050 [Candidatus Gottesmanbacteria bacterium RIFCSPHIGHO2_02_FULL_40_24]OGG21859.1 MAG: hypothetical protein A3B48_03980 [Candidatus Gottesmanbacteria bacterium RIFCSPLOWO2_01_FULL_40_10]OGG25490.1 MAG: hypothetical protein A3E42_03520 [Candidatus Gottesmanbacteria bacterium RIFCSPHIGHO2_12_FULL_40_13]OGG33149.1 MAG: hypothetical protein A3I80_0